LHSLKESENVVSRIPEVHSFYLRAAKILYLLKRYPIPVFAVAGLIVGTVAFLTFKSLELVHWIWLATLIVSGAPIVWDTIRGMLRGHFASDIVAMLAIITAILANEALPGVVIVIMQSGGKALEDYALRRASSSLDALLARSPRIAYKKKGDILEKIDVSSIKVGDLIVVRPGDLVPIDGRVTKGNVVIDESALTGEPLPKNKNPAGDVFSGTVNIGDAFEMVADKISEESQYAKIVQLVKKAQTEKAPIQRLADRYAIWFTPITLVVSFFGWSITGNPETILSVLVVATPCSLIFATPVAIMSGINKAAKRGIMIKSSASIEQVGKAEAVIFDKTGTITIGTPAVEKIVAFDHMSVNDLLFRAASIEQVSSHPVAAALVRKAQQNFIKLTMPSNFHELPGIGVEGDIDGDHIFVGSKSFFEVSELKDMHNVADLRKEIESQEKMLAFIEINNVLAGAIIFSDKIRTGVKLMMERLYKLGIKEIIILTGDSIDNAKNIAQQAGVTRFESNLHPEQKVTSVKRIRRIYKNVIMVGDGINDAPALASANVGIAMGAQGSAISAEAADMVLLVDDVTRVRDAIEIGRKTVQIAKQSIFVGLGASFICMIIASFGLIPPTVGALLQEVLDVCVILNALRAR
jgi:heavy metal translocating P-type ATPase